MTKPKKQKRETKREKSNTSMAVRICAFILAGLTLLGIFSVSLIANFQFAIIWKGFNTNIKKFRPKIKDFQAIQFIIKPSLRDGFIYCDNLSKNIIKMKNYEPRRSSYGQQL